MSYLSLAEMMKDFLISELCLERGIPAAQGPQIDERTLREQQLAMLELLELNRAELPAFEELKSNFKEYLATRDRLRQGGMSRAMVSSTMRRLAHSRIHQIERLEHFIDRISGDAQDQPELTAVA